MNASPAFQFYPRDWIASTRVQMLSLEEEGAYIRLLSHCWLHGSIPSDEELIKRLLGKGGFNLVITNVLSMFEAGSIPGQLVHQRLEAERRKQADWSEKSAAGGRKSAAKRWGKNIAHQQLDIGSLSNGGNQKVTLHLQSSSSSADNTLAPGKPARARDEVIDAVVRFAEVTIPESASPTIWPKAAAALKTIRAITPSVTAAEIERRATNYATHFSDASISATALAKHWGRCEQPKTDGPETNKRSNGRSFEQSHDYSGLKNKL